MSTLVIVMRAISVLAFAAPMLLGSHGRHRATTPSRPRPNVRERVPLIANLAAFALFFSSLLMSSSSSEYPTALPLAVSGCLVALAGAALVLRSRIELGAAWSLLPKADQGIVTTGPYRLVRHPIYLALTLIAVGDALAFGNGLAFLIALFGILPTFLWRARAEEKILSGLFGERYASYRRQTKRVIPYVV